MASKKRITDGMSLEEMMGISHIPQDDKMTPLRIVADKFNRAKRANSAFIQASLDPAYASQLKAAMKEKGLIKSDADFENNLRRSLELSRKQMSEAAVELTGHKVIRPTGASTKVRSRVHYK